MQTSRMFELVYLLVERGTMTAGELARRFEVSERTIRRDVDSLSAAGIPVYASRGRGGGVSLLPGFVLDRSLLSSREQDEILFALQSLRATGVEEGAAVLGRLSSLFRREGSDWIDVDFSYWGSTHANRILFPAIKEAILSRRVLSFDYYGSAGTATHRLVEPCKLRFKGTAWYLHGWCRTKRDFRVFRLSRMENVLLTQESFQLRQVPPLDPEPTTQQPPLIPVVLSFSKEVAFRVYDEFHPAAIRPGEDGRLIVTCQWPEGPWGRGYLLSFGSALEVLSPLSLVQDLKREAERITGLYSK